MMIKKKKIEGKIITKREMAMNLKISLNHLQFFFFFLYSMNHRDNDVTNARKNFT